MQRNFSIVGAFSALFLVLVFEANFGCTLLSSLALCGSSGLPLADPSSHGIDAWKTTTVNSWMSTTTPSFIVKIPNTEDQIDVIWNVLPWASFPNNTIAAKLCNLTSTTCATNFRQVYFGNSGTAYKSPYVGAIYNATSQSIYVADNYDASWGPYGAIGQVSLPSLVVKQASPATSSFKVLDLNDGTFMLAYKTYADTASEFYVTRCFDASCSSNTTWGLNFTSGVALSGRASVVNAYDITLSSDGNPIIAATHKGASCTSSNYQVSWMYCPNKNCSSTNVVRTVFGITDNRCNAVSFGCPGYGTTYVVTPTGQEPVMNFYNMTDCGIYTVYCSNAQCTSYKSEMLQYSTGGSVIQGRLFPTHTGGIIVNYAAWPSTGGTAYGSFLCLSSNRGNCSKNQVALPHTISSSTTMVNTGAYAVYANRTVYVHGGYNLAFQLADPTDEINAATPALAPPVAPAPRAPTPVAPVPVAPAPVAPVPVAPVPIAPAPVAPAPRAPTPVAPTPVAPAPAAPSPVAPVPVAPVPVAAAPAAPSPVEPAPVAPSPIAPVPVDTAPVSPSPTADSAPASVGSPQATPVGVPAAGQPITDSPLAAPTKGISAPTKSQISSSHSLSASIALIICAAMPALLL